MVIDYSLDLSSMSKELKLLLEFMKMKDKNRLDSLDNDWLADINWELLLRLAYHHRVYPNLYTNLKKLDNSGVYSHVVQALNQAYRQNTIQMLALCGEMELVSTLFTENQIPLLFLKGPVIAADLYGDLSQRTSKDLDLLISPSHVEQAERLLLKLGYEKENAPSVLNDWKWRGHHFVFYHPHKKIMIELHWRLEPFPSREPAFHELWERKRVSQLTNDPVYFLGEEDLFLYLVSHGARHGWFRLRWLLDIDRMVRKGFDLDKVMLLLQKYRRSHIGGQALLLAAELLNTPIDGELKKLTECSESLSLAQTAIEFINGMDSLAEISSTESYKCYSHSLNESKKFFNKLMLFYPSYSDVQTLKLPKPLHLLYFGLRPFLVIARKIRRISLKQSNI